MEDSSAGTVDWHAIYEALTGRGYCPNGPGGGITNTCGREGGGSMAGAKYDAASKKWTLEDGSPLPAHLAKKRIPPAWKNVTVNTDPEADLQVKGYDAKGRAQSVYSDSHTARQAAEKFGRVRELHAKDKQVGKKIEADLDSSDPAIRESAAALAVIRATGLRPGSSKDTGADKQAYGCTTLEGRHVVELKKGVRLRFTGKKGVDLDIEVSDPKVAGILKERASKAGRKGKLFDTNDVQLREYVKAAAGQDFMPKDFRTLRGTSIAAAEVAKIKKPPKTMKEYKKAVMGVAKVASQQLGNTPSICLKSYIDPTVFSAWRPE